MSWTAVAILGGIGVAIVLILFVAKRPMRSKSDHSRDHTYLFFRTRTPAPTTPRTITTPATSVGTIMVASATLAGITKVASVTSAGITGAFSER